MKYFLGLLAAVCIALPAFGKTHVIWVLGTEPLTGRSSSRAQFLAQLHKYPERERIALQKLGIDQDTFERGMRSAPSVVTGGLFHLDAMAYFSKGVKVARDVDVPKDTWMWVIHTTHKIIYVPQACGNISTVAAAGVESFATGFSVTAHQRAGGHARAAGEPVVRMAQATQAPFVTPAPQATPIAATAHHGGFPWWIFLLPVALIHGNSGSTGHIPPPLIIAASSSPRPSPSPSGTKTPCPTPTPKPTPTPCPSSTRK